MAHFEYPVLTKPSHFNFATDVVDYWASKSPEVQAMHWVSEDLSQIRQLPYTYFERQSHRIAVMLKDLGIRPGEVMLMILPRVPAWWEIAVAALRSGIVICSATVLLVEEDIQYRCLETGATAFIGDSASVRKFQNIRAECPAIKHVIQVDENVHRDGNSILDFYSTLDSIPQDARYEGPKTPSEQRALIYFTSGTSGPPKMAQHNHISYPLAHTLTGKEWLHLSPGKLYWNLSEQGWAKSAYSFFSAWNCGASLFIYDDRSAFNPIRLLSILHQFPITTLCAPPTAYRQLVLQKPRDYMKRFPPHSVSHCTSCGEPLNGSVVTTWQQMTGIEICDGYGQTETTLTCGNFGTAPIKPGSMGRPTPGIPLKVISSAGLECEAGVEGDIAIEVGGNDVHGPGYFGLFDGYLKRDGSLDRRISNMGGKSWYLTGDRAIRDEDGYFWFVGRADDVINSAGYRIGPFEVESTLKLHPAVIESAVVSSPDFSRGEVVKAFVVLDATYQSNKTDTDEFIKELQDFCKKHAAPYKYPRKIQIVDASFLPKTISGKIKRNELKALEWKEKSRL